MNKTCKTKKMGNRKLRLPFVGVDWGHRSRILACSSDKVKQIESRVEDVFRRLYWNVKEVFYCGCSSLWKSILIMKWWKVLNVSRVLLDKSLSCIYRKKLGSTFHLLKFKFMRAEESHDMLLISTSRVVWTLKLCQEN